MALSIQTLIESAINYTYAYALETQKTAAELQTMMPSPGRFPIQVSLCRPHPYQGCALPLSYTGIVWMMGRASKGFSRFST